MKKVLLAVFLTVFLFGLISAATSSEVNSTLNEKNSNLESIKLKIEEYTPFVRQEMTSALNISYLENQLENITQKFEQINSSEEGATEEYDSLIEEIDSLEIPQTIVRTKTANSITIFPGEDNFNFDVAKQVNWQDYNSSYGESVYTNSLILWTLDNVESKISLEGFSKISNGSEEGFLTVFDLEVSKKLFPENFPTLFLKKMPNMNFDSDYGQLEQGDYYYIELSANTQTISFSTTEDAVFEDVLFFVAPPISELNLETNEIGSFEDAEEGKFKWTLFTLVMIVLFIIAIIVYVALQVWYKKKYEAYLFKNKNDLYNIANYISSAKKKGMDNKQIEDNLRKFKWSKEQINYALRKYTGKRTGMFEIPLQKILKKKGELGK